MREASVREAWYVEFPLKGPSGEPCDLKRTFRSHGLASLPPMRLGENADVLEATLPVYGFPPRTVLVSESGPEHGIVSAVGPPPGREEGERLFAAVRHVLRLDEDLSGFYALAAGDPHLSWVTRGAGRMIRSPTVFEEVVKTLCTTDAYPPRRLKERNLSDRMELPHNHPPREVPSRCHGTTASCPRSTSRCPSSSPLRKPTSPFL